RRTTLKRLGPEIRGSTQIVDVSNSASVRRPGNGRVQRNRRGRIEGLQRRPSVKWQNHYSPRRAGLLIVSVKAGDQFSVRRDAGAGCELIGNLDRLSAVDGNLPQCSFFCAP